MKFYDLVAAMVLRVGGQDMRALTWAELGDVYKVTNNSIRHTLNRFKEKYNIIDSDVVDGWNRGFLEQHTPDSEQTYIADLEFVPGDRYVISEGKTGVVADYINSVVCFSEDGKISLIDAVSKDGKQPAPQKKLVLVEVEEDIPAPQFLLTPSVLVIVRDGVPMSIDKSHKNFDKIKAALGEKAWTRAMDLIDMKNSLTKYSNGRVSVEQGKVCLDGEIVHGKLSDRLIHLLLEENTAALDALSNFLVKCDENPDHRVVTRIYAFLTHNDLRLDKDGNILAYKIVKNNYKDKYTGTMDNSPGLTVSMKRNKVNPNDSQTCSFGLHVAAKGYLSSYGSVSGGDRVVLCQVHPKDFVSIPTDYNDMKARTCSYVVLKDVTENFQKEDVGVEA